MLTRAICAALALVLLSSHVQAGNPQGQVGGVTIEVCTGRNGTPALVVTPSSAYTAGNEVGQLIGFLAAVQSPQTGVLQSVRLTSKSVQTAEFDVTFFAGNPIASAWADKTAPVITGADIQLTQPPIKLTNSYSGLGTHTVYGADGIGRAIQIQGAGASTLFALITTTGTPTFASAGDLQLCASVLLD